MTSEIDSADRINTLMEECRQQGITVLPPDVNESQLGFTVVDDTIRFGMLAVKNVGGGAVDAIVSAREDGGQFESFADFVSRVNVKAINRRALESLIYAGAMDSLSGNRRQKIEVVEKMLEFANRAQAGSDSHDLFADDSGSAIRTAPELPDLEDFSATVRLGHEKETLGFYVSGHPLEGFRNLVGSIVSAKIADLATIRDGAEVRVAGIFNAVKVTNDKRGKRMAFATLEDFTGQVELIIFSDCYENGKELITEGEMALAIGRLSTREGEAPKVVTNEVVAMGRLLERFDCQVVIKVDADSADTVIESAQNALTGVQGRKPLLLSYRINGSEALIRSNRFHIDPDEKTLDTLKKEFGEDAVYVIPGQP